MGLFPLGLMESEDFPVNYFAVSEVEQEWDDFQDMFPEGSLPGDGSYWRFNRVRTHVWNSFYLQYSCLLGASSKGQLSMV